MKKILLLLIALALWQIQGRADTVSPYLMGFEDEFSTYDPAFVPGPGWGHIVDKGEEEWDKVSYERKSRSSWAYEGYGSLVIGTQELDDYTETYDLLVSPSVSGKVTLQVEAYDEDKAWIEFYAVSKTATGYVRGEKISVTVPELSEDDYAEVTIPYEGYIGIRGNCVVIDNFEAEKAEVELRRSLSFYRVKVADERPAVDGTGLFPLTFTIDLDNDGDTDISGFKLTVYDAATDTELFSQDYDEEIEKGGYAEDLELTGNATWQEGRDAYTFYIVESISGTRSEVISVSPLPNKAVMVLTDDLHNAAFTPGQTLDFGYAQGKVQRLFNLSNQGGKDIRLQEVSVTGDFSTTFDVEENSRVQPLQSLRVYVTMDATEAGTKQGTLTIKGSDGLDFTLSLTGEAVDGDRWLLNFEDGLPKNVMTDGGACRFISPLFDGKLNDFWMESTDDETARLTSPRLTFADGDQLFIDVARKNSEDQPVVHIYYGDTRDNLTLAKTISADDLSSDKLTYDERDYYALTTTSVSDIPAGDKYIVVEYTNARIDNLRGPNVATVAHDWLLSKVAIPEEGETNQPFTATASLTNTLSVAEEAGSYVAQLLFDDEVMAEAEARQLKAGVTSAFTFSFTPHEVGTHQAIVRFQTTDGTYTVASPAVAVTISAETAAAQQLTIGKVSKKQYHCPPVYTRNKTGEAEMVYTASMLEEYGLHVGDKIQRIAFRGYSYEAFDTHLQLYVGEEQEAKLSGSADGLTQVMDADIELPYGGKAKATIEMLGAKLSTPIVYNGGDLRIFTHHESDSYDDYGDTYFEVTSDQTHAQTRGSNRSLSDSWDDNYLPVLYLDVESSAPVLSGVVRDGRGNAVEGAILRLSQGNVEYAAKSDADGNYRLEVVQRNLSYRLDVSCEGLIPYAEDVVSVAGGDAQKDITLVATPLYSVGQTATVVLPVALTEQQAAEAGTFYRLKGYNGSSRSVEFEQVHSTEANTPYLFVAAKEEPFSTIDLTDTDLDGAGMVEADGITFQGTYKRCVIESTSSTLYYAFLRKDGSFARAGSEGGISMNQFRAFIVKPADLDGESVDNGGEARLQVVIEGTPTGIMDNSQYATDNRHAIYDLQGRVVDNGNDSSLFTPRSSLKKGIYVQKGKKVIR